MIDSIRGRLHKKTPTEIVVDVRGLRLLISVAVTAYEKIGAVGDEVEILTYLHFRQDILDLYGFANAEERLLFMSLIGISGIGPRSAITILSGTRPAEFKRRIIAGDVKSLTTVPGIGPKTAKRIIVELKEKFAYFQDDENLDFLSETSSPAFNDAVLALQSLGYKRQVSEKILRQMEKDGEMTGGLEIIIKKALANM